MLKIYFFLFEFKVSSETLERHVLSQLQPKT